MNTTKMMNLEQLEEVTGGVYHGRLDRTECGAFTCIIQLCKATGMPMEKYLESFKAMNNNKEFCEAVEKYIRTFWDHTRLPSETV